jgi:histidinol-phosphate/aromatic aminotransferase/cobyric acid decarboxylase-like protein
MQVLVRFTVPDSPDYTETDVRDALTARLDEFYPDSDPVVPEDVRVAVGTPEDAQYLLDAARVGLDGSPDAARGDAAWDLLGLLDG